MVYDEGFEIKIDQEVFFAFSKYKIGSGIVKIYNEDA